MLKRVLVAAVLAASPAWAEGPLQEIARHVPIDAGGEVYLVDLAASTRELGGMEIADTRAATLIPWTPLLTPPGFDGQFLIRGKDGFAGALGFSINDIGQMAGWRAHPETPVIIRSPALTGRAEAIAAALTARGFETSDRGGETVWHRLDDGAVDPKRKLEEPFAGTVAQAERFVLRDDTLFFARTWDGLDRLMSGGPSLMDDADAAAILAAAYSAGRGSVLDVLVHGPQADRVADLARTLDGKEGAEQTIRAYREAGPGLPPYARHGLVLWQNGTTTTGAVLIPYADAATARTAEERFTHLLDTLISPAAGRPFRDLLPWERDFDVVETGDRAVLVLAFHYQADVANGVKIMTFMRNPRRRLYDMFVRRELDLMIGGTE